MPPIKRKPPQRREDETCIVAFSDTVYADSVMLHDCCTPPGHQSPLCRPPQLRDFLAQCRHLLSGRQLAEVARHRGTSLLTAAERIAFYPPPRSGKG